MKMFSLVLALMIGTAMAVVEENAVEEWGSRSPPGNCHCEQTQAGGIHGHSSASFCDQDCPGGPFCSQARVPPPLLPSCDYPLAYPPSAPLLLPPPTCSHLLHTCVTCMFFINQRTPPHTPHFGYASWRAVSLRRHSGEPVAPRVCVVVRPAPSLAVAAAAPPSRHLGPARGGAPRHPGPLVRLGRPRLERPRPFLHAP